MSSACTSALALASASTSAAAHASQPDAIRGSIRAAWKLGYLVVRLQDQQHTEQHTSAAAHATTEAHDDEAMTQAADAMLAVAAAVPQNNTTRDQPSKAEAQRAATGKRKEMKHSAEDEVQAPKKPRVDQHIALEQPSGLARTPSVSNAIAALLAMKQGIEAPAEDNDDARTEHPDAQMIQEQIFVCKMLCCSYLGERNGLGCTVRKCAPECNTPALFRMLLQRACDAEEEQDESTCLMWEFRSRLLEYVARLQMKKQQRSDDGHSQPMEEEEKDDGEPLATCSSSSVYSSLHSVAPGVAQRLAKPALLRTSSSSVATVDTGAVTVLLDEGSVSGGDEEWTEAAVPFSVASEAVVSATILHQEDALMLSETATFVDENRTEVAAGQRAVAPMDESD